LVYVVAQVRFSAVESIPKYIPAIQDEFRKQFPRFTKGEMQNVRISPTAPPEISVVPRFEFQNKERTCGIVVQSDSVAVHVSRYSSFDLFCSSLQYVLDTVHSVVTLGLIDRIGLRYVDVVRPSEGEELGQYLHRGLLGLNDADVGVRRSMRMSVYQGETEAGTLRFRLAQRNDGGFLPPDVEPSPLSHEQPDVQPGEIVTLLDFDHFREFTKEPLDFSTDVVLGYLWRLHDNADLAFRAAVTEHALSAWGAEESDAISRNH
jgi:uncharacterized protein (TIGR04255 family)